ncbi:MAG: Ig-like domain-containing protein, partial [bacterium]|nr:Ig-like domain-containing protein [bacterium]
MLSFSRAMVAGTGDVRIMDAAGTEFERIPVDGRGTVAIAGQTVTITHAPFVAGSTYHVLIAVTCFRDVAGHAFAGITDQSAWSFTARQWVVEFAATGDGTLDGQTMQ